MPEHLGYYPGEEVTTPNGIGIIAEVQPWDEHLVVDFDGHNLTFFPDDIDLYPRKLLELAAKPRRFVRVEDLDAHLIEHELRAILSAVGEDTAVLGDGKALQAVLDLKQAITNLNEEIDSYLQKGARDCE